MKINPVDKQQWVKTNAAGSGKRDRAEDFGKVLEKSLQSAQASPRVAPAGKIGSPLLNSINPPMDVRQDVYNRLDRILGAFENYQLLLGDHRTSLKQLARAMEGLKSEAQDLKVMSEKMEDGDPLKSILNETLVSVSKEVFQFESGAYVD